MPNPVLWFIAGCWLGTMVAVWVLGLCVAAKHNDRAISDPPQAIAPSVPRTHPRSALVAPTRHRWDRARWGLAWRRTVRGQARAAARMVHA